MKKDQGYWQRIAQKGSIASCSSINMYNNDVGKRFMGGWMGLRVGFININDMYNNDVGKGEVRVYEAYEVK
jgi:hypothetical protein